MIQHTVSLRYKKSIKNTLTKRCYYQQSGWYSHMQYGHKIQWMFERKFCIFSFFTFCFFFFKLKIMILKNTLPLIPLKIPPSFPIYFSLYYWQFLKRFWKYSLMSVFICIVVGGLILRIDSKHLPFLAILILGKIHEWYDGRFSE